MFLYGTGFPKSANIGCKCRANALQYNHAGDSLRGVRQGAGDAECVVEASQAPDLFSSLQRDTSGAALEAARAQGPSGVDGQERSVIQGEDGRREQSRVAGRQLHRTREGLPNDPNAGASSSTGERLRVGAHPSSREDSRPQAETGRGSASREPGQDGQSAGESESLQFPSGALDDGASIRSSRCERCGGLTQAKGLGSALKPGYEPVVIARKPFKGTLADNYITHGTGAINIDACRIGTETMGGYEVSPGGMLQPSRQRESGYRPDWQREDRSFIAKESVGRWPANVLLDEIAAAQLDREVGELTSGGTPETRHSDKFRNAYGTFKGGESENGIGRSVGKASRFFYVAKPSREERDAGIYGEPDNGGGQRVRARNSHPT